MYIRNDNNKRNLNKQFCFTLFIGIVTGFIISFLILTPTVFFPASDPNSLYEFMANPLFNVGNHGLNEEFHQMENTTIANKLFKQIRVLCWILTSPMNHERKAKHIKITWGKRCNKLLFMSSKSDDSLPAVGLPVSEGRNNLWAKTKEAFKYIYHNHLHEADWFLKADDDTYVILENLRYMLMPYNENTPIYFGCRFKPYVKQGYMSGGAGYVLSREALKRFVELALTNFTQCSKSNDGSEDVEMGKCLESVQVIAGDSTDSMGRGRFFQYLLEYYLISGRLEPTDTMYYKNKEGMECCSDNAISFHPTSPLQMYIFDYLIYHLRPYGISFNFGMPRKLQNNSINSNNVSTT